MTGSSTMPYGSLADFISDLQDAGELLRVAAEVDPVLEIAEITARVSQSPGGGPALFFEKVRGSALPVAVNLLGSESRICRALGARSMDEIAGRVADLLQPSLPGGLLEQLKRVSQGTPAANLGPKTIKTADCQQIVRMGRDVDLTQLPALQCWPDDCNRFLSWTQVISVEPETGLRVIGNCPVQIRSATSGIVHWDFHDRLRAVFESYRRAGQQMPVAIVLGGDPVNYFAATIPLPAQTDSCLFAGVLRGKAIELVKCRGINLEVPADADMVLEGTIDTTQPLEAAGEFGRNTGFRLPAGDLPVWNVTALTHRANPVFPAALLGKPPLEHYWIGKAAERILFPLVRLLVPEIVDYSFPRCGAQRHLCFVAIRKTYPQQARKVMNAVWGLSQLMFSKIVVVVDESVDVHDEEAVWFHVAANVDSNRDVVVTSGPADSLDHATPIPGTGHKLGIDATAKLPEEGHPTAWPQQSAMSDEIRQLVDRRWSEYGIDIDPEGR